MMTLGLTSEEKPALIRLLREHPPRLDPAEGDPAKARTALAVSRRAVCGQGCGLSSGADRADHPKPDAAELSARCGAAPGATPQRRVQRDQTSA